MYITALVFALLGVLIGLTVIVAGRALARRRLDTAPARRPFESGSDPAVHAWSRYHVRFLPYALIFILFDMEMVFMYPWAVVFFDVGWKALAEMGMFITILVLGILYAWRERGFDWD